MLKKYFVLITVLGLVIFLGSAFSASESSAKSVTATKTEISLVDGVAVDTRGNVYISRRDNNIISRIDQKGNMTSYAGNGASGFSGDGGKANEARLNVPAGLAVDKNGNLFIADRNNHRIRKVDSRGVITTIAGTGIAGFSEVSGMKGNLTLDLSPGFGYTGIVVAMLAQLHPLGVIISASFVASIFVGADAMSRSVGVPNYIADVVVATSLLCMLVSMLQLKYRIRWK